ncbi:unnamed protein product, partial [Rotaria sp. Silwood2]
DDYRLKLKDILREPLESGAICVSPDLWSGDHMKISYLCITATFTTSNYEYKTVDLRCKPFVGDDHRGKIYINCKYNFFEYKIIHFHVVSIRLSFISTIL